MLFVLSKIHAPVQVLGGTFNAGSGCLEVRTTALAANSAVARMAALVDAVRAASYPVLYCLCVPLVWLGKGKAFMMSC